MLRTAVHADDQSGQTGGPNHNPDPQTELFTVSHVSSALPDSALSPTLTSPPNNSVQSSSWGVAQEGAGRLCYAGDERGADREGGREGGADSDGDVTDTDNNFVSNN